MNPVELIERQLNADEGTESCSVRELAEHCPFTTNRLFIVQGMTKRFDFPTLPHGSKGYYVANGHRAMRLTRQGKEIETVLSEEWDHLADANAVLLASLILKFYDGGIRETHYVLKDLDALVSFCDSEKRHRKYEIDEKQLSLAAKGIGSTSMLRDGNGLSVRAVTLRGWMHDKRNLGVERFEVDRQGHPTFEKRLVLSRRIFSRVPMIRY